MKRKAGWGERMFAGVCALGLVAVAINFAFTFSTNISPDTSVADAAAEVGIALWRGVRSVLATALVAIAVAISWVAARVAVTGEEGDS